VADEPGGKPSDLPAFLQDHEKIEEAKYYPPASPGTSKDADEEGELPDYYGEPKVMLLPVGPYLAYAYWEFDMARLPPDTASAVLRFLDAHEPSASPSFDVDVDLRTRNWYVHLWQPAEHYVADLGVKTTSGEFVPLARSNPLQTPRAWPMAEISAEPEEAPPVEEGAKSEGGASASLTEALQEEAKPQSEAVKSDLTEARIEIPAPPGARPAATWSIEAAPQLQPPQPLDAVEVLHAKLAEIYALRAWKLRVVAGDPPSPIETDQPVSPTAGPEGNPTAVQPETAPREPSPAPVVSTPRKAPISAPPITRPDLTKLAETRFIPGSSSAFPAPRSPEKPG
jgi:hypothetical protein